jgi:IS605 OrfB family transposase
MSTQTVTIKLRLRDKHAAELNRQARAVNFCWNFCNETSRKAWSRDHVWLSKFDLQRLTAGASHDLDLHAHTIQRVCTTFGTARDAAKRAGVRWRGKRSLGWVPFNTGHVSFNGSTFTFRKVAYEPMHLNPRLKAGMKLGAGSFNQDARGRWYINAPIEVDRAKSNDKSSVGIDLGLASLATLSTGEKIEAPRLYRKSEERLATLQRARKSKHVKRIHAKIANRRKDFLHKASAKIANEYGLIVVGDVSPSKIAQTKLAKSVHDVGWSDFKAMLRYKSHLRAGHVLEVSERHTSQTCSACGSLPPSRPRGTAGLGIREWTCNECGTVHDRDVNAAKNILRVGLDALVEGAAL